MRCRCRRRESCPKPVVSLRRTPLRGSPVATTWPHIGAAKLGSRSPCWPPPCQSHPAGGAGGRAGQTGGAGGTRGTPAGGNGDTRGLGTATGDGGGGGGGGHGRPPLPG